MTDEVSISVFKSEISGSVTAHVSVVLLLVSSCYFLGLGGIVSVVCSSVLSKVIKLFMRDLNRAAHYPPRNKTSISTLRHVTYVLSSPQRFKQRFVI